MNSIVKLEKIDFRYNKGEPNEVRALDDISIDIKQGEYISLFGPSGSGKSTLLHIISGVEKPSSGKVIVNGQNLVDFSDRELAVYRQIGIGIIFQNFNLIPSIKNIDNVVLPMAFLGISQDKREQVAMGIFKRLGIEHLAHRYPHELSGGQQQRVAIARALANDPPIILADEPLGNLDSKNARNVLDLLKEFNEKDGKTIIMVTHEEWSLRDVDKIFYLRDGKIIKKETKKDKKEEKVKQVGSSYYEKLFPELLPVESRAKIVRSAVLRGYSEVENTRLEYFIAKRIRGEITSSELVLAVDKPIRDGGVGLWWQTAKRVGKHVEDIMAEMAEAEKVNKKLDINPRASIYEEVENTREWLLEGSKLKLNPLQLYRIEEAISGRFRNVIKPGHFRDILDLPKSKGGVGLRLSASLRIADKLEIIFGQNNKQILEQGKLLK